MARRYGSKQQTKQAKRTAAMAFVHSTFGQRDEESVVKSLVGSYGMSEPEARFFYAQESTRAEAELRRMRGLS